MPRATTTSFIAELPLVVAEAECRELGIRLEAERHLENAVLGECLRRLKLMRESKAWQAARKLPKGSEDRRTTFKAIREAFDFKSSMADRFAIACKNGCWIKDHMTANEAQKAALRSFQAVQQYAIGKKGRPRFKAKGTVNSIEGKSNKAGIRWLATERVMVWNGLRLKALIDTKDVWLEAALKSPTKYCRLVRRSVRGKDRFYLQLVQEGVSPPRCKTKAGVVGLDLGPSTIAAVAAQDAILEPFCPTVEQPWKELRLIERAMDRSRRATNPANFNANGTVKKGSKIWTRSKRYQRLALERRERERRLAAERKMSHGNLVSRVLAQGTTVKTEKLSYRSFQKNFGRSSKVRGVGSFVALLRRRAKEAGGQLIEFDTRTTKLSQYDHTTNSYTKKPLSQRQHVLGDGSGVVQRDLYSAFLARHVGSKSQLEARKAEEAFPTAKQMLGQAASGWTEQSSSGCGFLHPTRRTQSPSSERIACQGDKKAVEAANGVAPSNRREGRGETPILSSKPPAFRYGDV